MDVVGTSSSPSKLVSSVPPPAAPCRPAPPADMLWLLCWPLLACPSADDQAHGWPLLPTSSSVDDVQSAAAAAADDDDSLPFATARCCDCCCCGRPICSQPVSPAASLLLLAAPVAPALSDTGAAAAANDDDVVPPAVPTLNSCPERLTIKCPWLLSVLTKVLPVCCCCCC